MKTAPVALDPLEEPPNLKESWGRLQPPLVYFGSLYA
jgi:hypothetical protein